MFGNVKAKYENGVLTPSERLEIEEGAEVTLSLTVEQAPPSRGLSKSKSKSENGQPNPAEPYDESLMVDGLSPSDGLAWLAARIEERQANDPPGAYDGIPADLAMNHKHYLYGYPKEGE